MFIMLVGTGTDEINELKTCVEHCYPDSIVIPFDDSLRAMNFIKSGNAHIDVCFTQINMPKVSGFGLVTELRKRSKDTKTVFISDTPDYAIDAWNYCVNDYILTPVTNESIEHALMSCFSCDTG